MQKGSPLTEDINHFIHLANQIGLIDSKIQDFMPYASKCATWPDIEASHNSGPVQLQLEYFYGILGFMGIGLVVGGIATILELLYHGISIK